MENTTIQIKNFKLKVFRNLLKQSLIVNNQLMLEFSNEFIKSCSFSGTESFMKLWTIPTKDILHSEIADDSQLAIKLDDSVDEVIDFPAFNFYILKGNLFDKYLSVFSSDIVDLEFNLIMKDGKYQATNISIIGKTEINTQLKTNFTLTTEELITHLIKDYSEIISMCTPSENMYEFVIGDNEMSQLKKLVKQLHASVIKNTAFLNFAIAGNCLKVSDKSFETEIILPETKNLPKIDFSFNILKSDFIMTGKHSFTIYTNETDNRAIFGAKYGPSIIWCLSNKIPDNAMSLNEDFIDNAIADADLSEYDLGTDDLPF